MDRPDRERLRRRDAFLKELQDAKALRERVTPRRARRARANQVHLGGSLGADQAFGRKLRGLKVTSAGLTDYVERILRNYSADRNDGEAFATWVRRADEALLQ